MSSPKKTFDEFLKDSLTANDYERLNVHLSDEKLKEKTIPLSAHRITKIKHNPRILTAFELIALARLVKKSPAWLSEEYKCGWDEIGINSMELINRTFAQEVQEGARV